MRRGVGGRRVRSENFGLDVRSKRLRRDFANFERGIVGAEEVKDGKTEFIGQRDALFFAQNEERRRKRVRFGAIFGDDRNGAESFAGNGRGVFDDFGRLAGARVDDVRETQVAYL